MIGKKEWDLDSRVNEIDREISREKKVTFVLDQIQITSFRQTTLDNKPTLDIEAREKIV